MNTQNQRYSYGNGATDSYFQGVGVGMYLRAATDDPNSLDQWVAKFSKVWGFARAPSVRRSSTMNKT